MMSQATLCATSRGKELRSCRKDCWRWKLHALTVAVTWLSSVIDESVDCDTENLQMVGHFYARPINSDLDLPSVSDKALPSASHSSDRLVWVEEEPVVPEPVLESGDCWCRLQCQVCEIELIWMKRLVLMLISSSLACWRKSNSSVTDAFWKKRSIREIRCGPLQTSFQLDL